MLVAIAPKQKPSIRVVQALEQLGIPAEAPSIGAGKRFLKGQEFYAVGLAPDTSWANIPNPHSFILYLDPKPIEKANGIGSIWGNVSERNVPSLEQEFNRLAAEWKRAAKGPLSSPNRIVNHPAYLEIISHGEEMIPFILRDLEKEPNHWFIALKILAKQFSPVKPEDAGNIKKMTEAWLDWGRRNGKLG